MCGLTLASLLLSPSKRPESTTMNKQRKEEKKVRALVGNAKRSTATVMLQTGGRWGGCS